MDAASEEYVIRVAAAMTQALESKLVGVYLHGSGVLGGFDARRSDVDILVVSAAQMTGTEQSASAELLSEERLACPAQGLELSVVTEDSARHPVATPAFELHVTTAPADPKVVDGHQHTGDSDLVLHYAVARAAGRLIGPGPAPGDLFAAVPEDLVVAQLVDELRWGVEHASGEYAVLNTCRAWRFAQDGTITSKLDGGLWALSHGRDVDRDLIQAAIDRQRLTSTAELDRAAVTRFVHHALEHLMV